MDSTRKRFNLGSGILALFVVGLLLGTVTLAWAEPAPTFRDASTKGIAGFIDTRSPYISPGSSGTWLFNVWNTSGDGEKLDQVTMDFPAGITVTGSSIISIHPDTTTRYLQTDGSTGDGVVVTWSDPNGGTGEIGTMEMALFSVNVSVDAGFVGNVVINYTMSGDGTGAAPHDIAGSETIPTHWWVKIDSHAPFYVTGDFQNVLVMNFILTDDTANDWLDAITLYPGPYDIAAGGLMSPTWFDNVELWHDFNGNDIFEPGLGDLQVGNFTWDGDSWVLSGLGLLSNSPVTTAGDRYFVAVDIATACPDDAFINFMIPLPWDLGTPGVFDPGDEGFFTVGLDVGPDSSPEPANFYVQIANRHSVMADYTIHNVTDPDWTGPTASQLLVLDFEVPDNWTLADQMTAITFFNSGTASNADIVTLQLWRDDATPGWGSGGETVVGECDAYIDDQHWYLDLSATPEAIPHGGKRFFLTCDIPDTATNGATIQMGIPQMVDVNLNGAFDLAAPDEGVFFASRNDGPFDGDLINSEAIVIDSGPPVIGFTNGVGSLVPDANSYGSYIRQTTVTTPMLAVGSGHVMTTPVEDTNLYGAAWGAMIWSKTIKWTVTYDATIVTPDKWVVEGQNADGSLGGPGIQTGRATSGVAYSTDAGELTFTLTEGPTPVTGDYLYFYTTRNIVGLANPELVDTGGEALGDEVQDELDKDEIIVSVDGITDPGSGVAQVRIYCTFDNSDPATAKASTMKNLVNVAGNRWWTNGAVPENILSTEVIDGKLVQFIVWAIDNVGNVAESEIQMAEIDDTGPTNVAPTFAWNTDNTLLPPSVANVGDILDLQMDFSAQEVPSFTEIVSIKCDVTGLLNATAQTFYYLGQVGPYNGHWEVPVVIADGGGTTGKDDDTQLPSGLAAVVQVFDHIGNMDLTQVWNLADNAHFNGFDNFIPETPAPTVELDQDNTPIPANTVNIGDVVQVEVDVNAVDDTGVLFVTVDMRAYGTSYGAAEMLNDGGYDGDDVAGDGIYSREFEVEDAGAFAVDQLNLDNTVSAILTDDAGNPDTTPEMIAAGNPLDIDTDAPGASSNNFDIAVNIGGVNWLDYYGHASIANPGDRAIVRWDSGPTGDNETDDLLSIVADLHEWGGPSAVDMLPDQGGQQGGSYNDWDGDHGADLKLYGALYDFVLAPIDDPETFCYLTVTDDAGNVVTVSTGTEEPDPAEPLSVDLIFPVGSLSVSVGYSANPPKAAYAGIGDTLKFVFNAQGTNPWDVSGVTVDLTDFGYPANPLALIRDTTPPADTVKWYGWYQIAGAGLTPMTSSGLMPSAEIAVDKDIDFEGTVWDDALNGFTDNYGQMIHCDNTGVVNIMGQYTSIWITHSNLVDGIAAIGDTIWFGFDNSDATGQDVGDIRNGVAGVYVDKDRDGKYEISDLQLTDPDLDEMWTGFHVVTDSSAAQPWAIEDTAKVTFGFYAMDNGMNTSLGMGYSLDSIYVDNIRPEGTLSNSSFTDKTFSWNHPVTQKVSVGDEITMTYALDRINDNVSVLVDMRAYGYGASEDLGALLLRKFTVMDVDDPDYILDVLKGNALIELTMTICMAERATDNAGNEFPPAPDDLLCVLPFDPAVYGVDNDAPPMTAVPTIMVMDDHDFKGNGKVNFGDRIDILCNMSAVPDMAGGKVRANLFGYGGNASDNIESGLLLSDDAFSQGGEGDLVFSYVLEGTAYTGGFLKGFVVGSGNDGAPGAKGVDDDADGQVDNAEELFVGDDRTGNIDTDKNPNNNSSALIEVSKIEVKAYDDDGCPAESPAESGELSWVVDTQEPGLDDVDLAFHDSDGPGEPGQGIVNIGDTLVVTVERLELNTDIRFDYYGDIPVTVDMSAYGYSTDEPITTVLDTTLYGEPKTWYRSFLVMEGDNGIDVGASDDASRVPAIGWDDADNWMLSPISSSPIPRQVDSDMPAPVTGLAAAPVQGGRIKLSWTHSPATDKVYYHIYVSEPDADTVDYTTPTESINPGTNLWYSDTLLVNHTYLFGIRVQDDAGNIEQNTNVASGKIPDSVVPFATLTSPPNGNLLVWGPDGLPGQANVDDDGVNGVDDPGEVGFAGTDDYTFDVVATMSDMDVVKAAYYWRIKDADPLLEGDQPGPWIHLGTVNRAAGVPEQETFTLTLDGSGVPSNTYEVIVVPTDGADNFPTHMEAYEFSHLTNGWDNNDPSLIYLSVNGDASPDAATLIPQGIIPMIAHAEDYGQQGKAVGRPQFIKVSVKPNGYLLPIAAYENDDVADWPHHFTINTTGFPNGPMMVYLWLLDPSGNMYSMPAATVTIEDITAPVAVITNPDHGDHITGEAFPIIVEPGLDAYGNPVTDLARVDAFYSEDGNEPWNWIGFDTTPEEDKQASVFFMIPWNTTNLVHDEDYYLYCEITDIAGNKGQTATIMVIKDDSALPLTLEIKESFMVDGVETIRDTVRINAWHNDPNTSWVTFKWRYAWEPDEDASYDAIGTDWSAPYWYMFNTNLVGGANYDQQNYPIVIKATPRDNAGNDMVGVLYPVTVDNKAPWFSIYSVNGFINSNDVNVMGGTDAEIVVHTLDADVALCRLQVFTPDGPIGIAELTAYDSYDPVTGVYSYSATWTAPVYNDNTDVTLHCGGRDIIDNRSMPQGGDDFFELEVLGTSAMTVMMAVPQHGTNIMGTWAPGTIQGTTGNTDVARAELQFQTPGETVWHTYGNDIQGPTWENPTSIMTNLMTDGDWNMRWKAWDVDNNPDPEPQHITVTIDNTPPTAEIQPIGKVRANKDILLTATCSDPVVGSYPADVQYVDFWVKPQADTILNYSQVGRDYTAPYEYLFDTRTVADDHYHVVATGTDNAGFQYGFPGNTQDPTYAHFELLEIDNSGPANLMISDIGDDHNPPTTGSTLPQMEEIDIVGTSTDLDVAWMRFYFKHIDAFDYNEIDTDTEIEVIDGQSVGTAVVNTMNWTAGEIYVIKVEAADDLGNEMIVYYDFKIGVPMAYIISIDDETGEIVAECNETAKLVKFDFEPVLKGKKSKSWEGIGISSVDSLGYAKIIWHYDEMAVGDGNFNVRAWASDDPLEWAEGLKQPEDQVGHWSLAKTGNVFEIEQSDMSGFKLTIPSDNSDPKLIQANVWVPYGYGEPTLYVVMDDAPNDPFVGPVDYEVELIPSPTDPHKWEPDPNCQVRIDPIQTGGVADFYATLPSLANKGAMDVLHQQLVVNEVTLTDGGSATTESGNWTITIPPGALWSGADGLVARDVAVTPQSPSHQLHLKPIGTALSVFMVSTYQYYFNAGYYAVMEAHYSDSDLPEGFDETQLSAAYWLYYDYEYEYGYDYYGEWEFDGIRIISHDTANNILTFHTDYFRGWWEYWEYWMEHGTIFTLIANVREENCGTIQISTPEPLPVVDQFTWAMPHLRSIITDEISQIDRYEVEMWLDGVRIWDDNDAANGFSGAYDWVSGELRVWWSEYYYEGNYYCYPPLVGGEHELVVTAMNNVENYCQVENTFTVEYPHEGSITDIVFLGSGNARLIDGVWYTDEFPVLQANVYDPFARQYYEEDCDLDSYYAGVVDDDFQVEIDGIEYAACQYFTGTTGYWGVLIYEQPEELIGGQHTYTITFTRNQVSYTYTGTFMVETVDVSSIKQVWWEEPKVVAGGYTWVNDHPVIKANISDLFGTLTSTDIELRIDGREYTHVNYVCGSTGDAGIMTYTHPTTEGLQLGNGKHYFTLGVTMNGVTYVTAADTFMVDANEPTLSGYTGGYVSATPTLTFTVSDLATGVDTKTIHMDLYQMVQTTTPPNEPERKEFLYTAFPSMMNFQTTGNDIRVTYNPVLNLQDNEELEITLYGGTFGYLSDQDDVGSRLYRDSDGITDMVDNILTPATKRFIVDASGPVVAEMEVTEDGMIYYIFQDLGSGITCEDIEITMDDEPFTDYECEQLDRTRVAVMFDPGDLGAEFKVKVTDGVGNFVIERFINETADVSLGEDAHCYPNPATDDKVTIVYSVTKRTGVELSIKVYDFAGEPVKTLFRGVPSKVGVNEITWYLDDDEGKYVGRGAYLCRIVAQDDAKTSARVVKIAVAQSK